MGRKKNKTKVIEKKVSKSFFETEYKKLLIIPALLLVLSLVAIGSNISKTGDFVDKGVSLKGGLTMTILAKEINSKAVENFLNEEYPSADLSVRSISEFGEITGVIIETGDISEENLVNSIKQKIPNLNDEDYSVETIGASLGDQFFNQTIKAIIIAFIFMAIVVFFYFKTIIPSTAVVLAAFSDIVMTLAAIDLLGVKLSTAGVAAFLMLIGYSVDTDILLSTRVLKNSEGTVYSRVIGAMKTGLVMNLTTLAAVSISLLITQSEVIRQIMLILFIGLIADLINTWLQNAGILRWYLEK